MASDNAGSSDIDNIHPEHDDKEEELELKPGRIPGVVLVAIDGSRTAEHALDWYLLNVHVENAEVIILHSVELTGVHAYPSGMMRKDVLDTEFLKEKEKAKDLERAIAKKMKKNKIHGRFVFEAGIAGEVIVRLAKELNAQLIVLGTRGWGKLRRALLGSVGDYVVHHATCGVLTVRKNAPLTR